MKTLPTSLPRRILTAILGLTVVSIGLAGVPTMSPEEAARLVLEGKALLVDVREPSEWAESGVAAPAVLLSKSDFEGAKKDWAPFLESVGDRQVIVYCRSGRRAESVAAALAKEGVNVANAGGFAAWKDAGLPTRAANQPAGSQ
ncbi:MAG TPA: rhodanese-like domain-containing protein [Opitutaceae bacterium]|nr:rhodanese-like domain-containing protein [Opitutaceae bacterium]